MARCVIRRYRPGDGPLLNEAVAASRDHLKPWMPWVQEEQTPEESEELVRKFHANWLWPRTDMTMGIFDLNESRLLGGTGLHRIDWNLRSFEIGYWIRPDMEGKGLVTEVARELTRFSFDQLDARRVFIRCDASNHRSAAVPRRLGFVEEARLLNAVLRLDGTVGDSLSFGMTPEMWESLKIGEN